MILCDTGVLLCLIGKDQPKYEAYVGIVATRREPMLTTWACIVEAMYLALATLVLAAEKTGIKRILTLDSDFYFYA